MPSAAQTVRSWSCWLPGRRGPIVLCHKADPSCARCTTLIAAFLAHEMRHDISEAIDYSPYWYRLQLDDVPCTIEQARELRRLTVLACCRVSRELNPQGLFLADGPLENVTAHHFHTSAPDTPITVFGRLWRYFSARLNRGVSQ